MKKNFNIKEFLNTEHLPRKNKNLIYQNLFNFYQSWGEGLSGESYRQTFDLVTDKTKKKGLPKSFIIESGWHGGGYYTNFKREMWDYNIDNHKVMAQCLPELAEVVEKPSLGGILSLSGEFEWNIEMIFEIFNPKDYHPEDEDKFEDNFFIFLTNGKKKISIKDCTSDHLTFSHSLLYPNSVSEDTKSKDQTYYGCPSVWENSLQETIEENEVDDTLNSFISGVFKSIYQFDFLKKKWVKCKIFSI